jgi:hypothetical protein
LTCFGKAAISLSADSKIDALFIVSRFLGTRQQIMDCQSPLSPASKVREIGGCLENMIAKFSGVSAQWSRAGSYA